MMGTYKQRLWLIIRNTANPKITLHLIYIFVKLGPERSILNIVNGSLKTGLFIIYGHTCPSGSQMGMIVRTEKQIKHAVFL